MTTVFGQCEICASENWSIVYSGPVRDGTFGNLTGSDSAVGRCGTCGVERLDEASCKEEDFYTDEAYRVHLNEATDATGFFAQHDVIQLSNVTAWWPETLRGKAVVDIGCAAGSFLDHVSGLVKSAIAIEPCEIYHDTLQSRGYSVYGSTAEAAAEHGGRADIVFSFSVIEHVADPLEFLSGARSLLKPGGKALVSTPNRRDILMSLLPDEYSQFFYRAVHRWYFDVESFGFCAERAGFNVEDSRCHHRFSLSNALAWLRDKAPSGEAKLPHLDDALADNFWRSFLESKGIGDYLYFSLTRAN